MTKGETAPAANPPHYLGHRERLRDRFRNGGADALGEYELLELILFRAMPRRDVKPLAKALIARFGSFAEVVAARPERLGEIEGLGDAAIVELKIIEAAAKRLAKNSGCRCRVSPRSSITAAPRWPSSITRNFASYFSTRRII